MHIFWISLTEECNFSCTYCFQHASSFLEQPRGKMNSVIAEKISTVIKNFPGNRVHFFGGEPFLNFSILKRIVQNTSDCTKSFSATTNLSITNSQILEFIEEYEIELFVSIDGNRNSHNIGRKFKNGTNSFDIVHNNLKALLNMISKEKIKIFKTLTEENYMNFYEDFLFLSSFGIDVTVNIDRNIDYSKINHSVLKNNIYKILEALCKQKKSAKFWRLTDDILIYENFGNEKSFIYPDNMCNNLNNFIMTFDHEGFMYLCHLLFGEQHIKSENNILELNTADSVYHYFINEINNRKVFSPIPKEAILQQILDKIKTNGCYDCFYKNHCIPLFYTFKKTTCFFERYLYHNNQNKTFQESFFCIDKFIYETLKTIKGA